MRTVLCYGDSNTWGADPETGGRFTEDVRWPGILRRELGEGSWILEEGLNGRTTIWDDPIEGVYKNGKTYLMPCLESHAPLDLVVLMLGTNDLKRRFSVSASDIAQSAASLADIIQRSGCGPDGGAPEVLLISPPPVGKLTDYAEMFEGAGEKSMRFAERYKQFPEQQGCHFMDASTAIASSDVDGIHFEAGEHRKLGEAVAKRVGDVFA